MTVQNAIRRPPLFDFLAAKGIKSRWLAEQIGVDETYVSAVKNGRRRPSQRFRDSAARALGIPASMLFFAPDELSRSSTELVSTAAEEPAA